MDLQRKERLKETKKFKQILFEKYPKIRTTTLDKCRNILYVNKEDVQKYLEIKSFPKKYFEDEKTIKGDKYCVIADLKNFIHYSVNDDTMGEMFGPTGGHVMWRNPHYVIDFHKPMGWYESEKDKYSVQVSIMTDIIENAIDKHGYERGKSEFDMNQITETNFRVDYCFPLLKLLIEINEDQHKTSLREIKNDEEKDKLKDLEYQILQIDESRWSENREETIILIKYCAKRRQPINYLKYIMDQTNDITDLIKSLGQDIIENHINNINGSNPFIYPLLSTIKKFGIQENTALFDEILSNFRNSDDCSDDIDKSNYDSDCDSDCDFDSDDFDSSDNDSDNESNDGSDNEPIHSSDTSFVIKGERHNTLYKRNVHYVFNENNNQYYLTTPTMIMIAIKSNKKEGIEYVELTWKLIDYIKNFGPIICEEYNKLLDENTLSIDDLKRQHQAVADNVRNKYAGEINQLKRDIQLKDKAKAALLDEISTLKNMLPLEGKDAYDRYIDIKTGKKVNENERKEFERLKINHIHNERTAMHKEMYPLFSKSLEELKRTTN